MNSEVTLLKLQENHIADCPLCFAAIKLKGATVDQIYNRKCEVGKKLWDEFIEHPYIINFIKEYKK